MILRTFYAITNAIKYRKKLRSFLTNPFLQLKNVTELTPVHLQEMSVQVLVLDFDGVLAAHGEVKPRQEVLQWLLQFVTIAKQQIYILSNKPTDDRYEYFKQHFPSIRFIKANRKKPYPDGLQQIIEDASVSSAQVLLVDDRLTTGILATCIANTRGLWVKEPYINLKARPVIETGFIILRFLERNLLSL